MIIFEILGHNLRTRVFFCACQLFFFYTQSRADRNRKMSRARESVESGPARTHRSSNTHYTVLYTCACGTRKAWFEGTGYGAKFGYVGKLFILGGGGASVNGTLTVLLLRTLDSRRNFYGFLYCFCFRPRLSS